MTRLKKFLSATMMVLVTVFSYLGTAVVNVARSIFTFGTASALEPGKNTNDGATVQGDIVSVPGFEKSIKKGEEVVLPHGGDDGIKVTLADLSATNNVDIKNVYVQIVNNYGEELTTWVENEGTKLAGYDDTTSAIYQDASNQITITANSITLKPNQSGTYKVKYYVLTSNNVWTSSSAYDIVVAAEAYSLSFMANDATVMPTMFNSEKNQTIDIALPLVYDENCDVITEDIVLGEDYGEAGSEYHYVLKYEDVAGTDGVSLKDVTKLTTEDTNVYKEYKTYTVKKVNGSISTSTAKYNLKVSVTMSDGTVLNNYDSTTRLESANATAEAGVYDLNPYSFSTTETTGGGKHIVTYNLYKMDGGNVFADAETYMTQEITGSKSFDEDSISVVASVSSKLKSSDVSYREKKYLPKVNAVNSSDSNNSVNAFHYYTIQVEDGDDLVADVDSVTMGRDENGFYFIPKAARSSYYDISYVAIDAFGNSSKDSNNDDNYTIQVWDNNPPKAVFTTAYDMTTVDQSNPDTLDGLEDISYVIPSKIATGGDVYLRVPALAASDYSGLSSTSRRIYSSAFLKNGNNVSSSKYMTITDASNGLPSQNNDIGGDINDYLYFVDYEGRHINAAGYFVSTADHSVYVDANGTQVAEENKVFAFKDGENNLTGTKLRDALNSCEAFVKLDPTIFGEGTYSLILTAQDVGQNRLNTNRENKFELVAELNDDSKTTPVVEFANSNITEVGSKTKVKLAVPTAKDDVDTRLNVKYYLNISNTLYEIEEKDGYLEFAMNDEADATHTYYQLAQTAGSFKVVAYAFNDYSTEVASLATATEEQLSDAHIGYDEYTISVKKATDAMPTITAIEATAGTPTQFEEFEVKGFTFHDDTNTVRVRATVTDTNGNTYKSTAVGGMTITGDADHGYDYVYGGIKFNPTNADRDNYYTVTFTLVDGANNVLSYSIVLVHAVDKTGPTITGLTGDSSTIELGQQYTFSKLKAVDNFSDSTTITAEVKDAEGNNVSPWFNMSNLTFSPEEAGTYTIKFTATDLEGNPSQERTFTITVEDTLAPVIKLNGATSNKLLYPESTITKDANDKDVYAEVELPTFSVSDSTPDNVVDALFSDTATGKITVTAPKKDSNSVSTYTFDMSGNILNSVVNTLEFKKDGNKYVFTPTSRGAYTITYSATDASGNEATSQVITVNVGDTENPQIFLVSDLKSALENGFVLGENASLVINNNAVVYNGDNVDYNSMTSFYVKDNAGFESTTDTSIEQEIVSVTVKITNSNGTEITTTSSTDNKLHYDFTTAGQYTMTLTVTDKVGNKETMTKTFTVSAKESSKSNSSAVLGTILIIVSALILAGVIIYFVRGTKMLPKNNSKKANKKED